MKGAGRRFLGCEIGREGVEPGPVGLGRQHLLKSGAARVVGVVFGRFEGFEVGIQVAQLTRLDLHLLIQVQFRLDGVIERGQIVEQAGAQLGQHLEPVAADALFFQALDEFVEGRNLVHDAQCQRAAGELAVGHDQGRR